MTRKNDKVVATIRRRKIEAIGILILYFFLWLLFSSLISRSAVLEREFLVLYVFLTNFIFFYFTVYRYFFAKSDLRLLTLLHGGIRLKTFSDCPKLWNAYLSVIPNNDEKIWLCASATCKYDASNLDVNYFQSNSLIISRGIIEDFSEKEISTIIGHELGHKRSWTIIERFRLFFELVIKSHLLFYIILCFASVSVEILKANPEKHFTLPDFLFLGSLSVSIGSLMMISWGIINELLRACFSRKMEYLADIYAAEMTGEPELYAIALEKIGRDEIKILLLSHRLRNALSKLYFNYLRTHPPIAMRILELKRLYDF